MIPLEIRKGLLVLMILMAGCQYYTQEMTITNDGIFNMTECIQRRLVDQFIMIESKYCSHCKDTLPVFIEACKESGVEPVILDLTIHEHREQMESYGIEVQYTPTFILGCEYFIGTKSKEDYIKMIDKVKDG